MNEPNKPLLERIKSNKLYIKLKGIKNIEIIIAVIVCLLAVGIYLAVDGSKKSSSSTSDSVSASELEKILEKIEGVGKTEVLITYGTEGESVLGQEDSSMVLEPESGNSGYFSNKSSLSVNGKNVKIIGIIIVCEGASNTDVQAKLLNAVQVATGVSINKIRIFQMKGK